MISYSKLTDLQTHEVFYDKLGFVTIQMPNFDKSEDELETNLDKWLFLLKNMQTMKKVPSRLQSLIFQRVFNIAEYTVMSKADQKQYEESLKQYNDLKNSLDTAHQDGFEKAELLFKEQLFEAQARETQAINDLKNAALNLKKINTPIYQIATILNKTEKEIEEILKEQ